MKTLFWNANPKYTGNCLLRGCSSRWLPWKKSSNFFGLAHRDAGGQDTADKVTEFMNGLPAKRYRMDARMLIEDTKLISARMSEMEAERR